MTQAKMAAVEVVGIVDFGHSTVMLAVFSQCITCGLDIAEGINLRVVDILMVFKAWVKSG